MDRLLRLRTWLERHRELTFEGVRIYLGLALFAKGVWFATHAGAVSDLLEGSRWQQPAAVFIDSYVALAHLAGGLMLLIGLMTRLAAAVQLPVLLGAIFVVHPRQGLFTASANLELEVLVVFLLSLVVVHGGGKWSVDAWLTRSFEAHLPPGASPPRPAH